MENLHARDSEEEAPRFPHARDRAAAAQKQASPLTRARWAVADERKFRALITELKAINDSLMSLLPASATVIGVIVLHQLPRPPEIVGIALVAAGVALRAEPAG